MIDSKKYSKNKPDCAEAYVAIGTNLDDRSQNIISALEYIGQIPGITILKRANIYESIPIGVKNQPLFLNTAVKLTSLIPVGELFGKLLDIERKMGRGGGIRFGPRIIDLDLIFFADCRINEPKLIVPHPRAHLRDFVLKPLIDLEASFIHPVFGKSVQELYNEIDHENHTILSRYSKVR